MGCASSAPGAPPPNRCLKPPAEQEAASEDVVPLWGDTFNNILMLTDSYKVTHHLQYPPGTSLVYSYFECRGGAYEEVCFFGLQYFIKRYLTGSVVTQEKIDNAEIYFKKHFSHPVWGYQENLFNKEAWKYILDKKKGKLPVTIKAIPEGTVVTYKNVLFTLENTDPQCYWLTNYLETLLVQVWYPTTVCTQSREQKKIITKYLKETGTPEVVENGLHLFKLHDFGFRGVSSVESAATGGAGHLVNFLGSDTMAALILCKEYYREEEVAGYSIPASEHSTMTSWGRTGECDAMKNMLEKYPKGIVACVSDSYDVFQACKEYWGTAHKELIEKREGFLVVRPDSGELPGIVIDVLKALESKFGSTKTSTDHRLLPPCIRIIQGDGIDIKSLEVILKKMSDEKFAADNLAFGSGGALLQKLHRDTQKCAFKCSYAVVNNQGVDVIKDPITDPGKKSKKGKLTLELKDGKWETMQEGKGKPSDDQLVTVFSNGELMLDQKLATIRKRANGEANVEEKKEAIDWVPKQLYAPLSRVKDMIKSKSHQGLHGDDAFSNIVMLTDSYKVTHHLQYPPGTKTIYSYFECRGGEYPEVCFFGLQYFLKAYMIGEVVTKDKINVAETYFKKHFSHPVWGYQENLFNREGWEYIVSNKGGMLPVSIKAVPEGTVCDYRNVLFTLENTDDKCFWLSNYLETLLVQVWYPTTVCSQSRAQKKIIMQYLKDTGCGDVIEKGLHLFKLHDFGFRGVSSVESAAIGGAAHLVNFMGTDTMAALVCVDECYGEGCGGFSIPASEHSTMTSWGKEGECEAMKNMLEKYPKGLVACVSDSYDIFNACSNYWGGELKGMIEQRDGILVVRPDSGEIPKIVIDVLDKLEEKFGSTKTSTGHKLLPDKIRVIQGDGIDIKSLELILKTMKNSGYAADNLAFGSGGALLQKLHRDTNKCAFKCSHALVGDTGVDVVKDPITDPGKKSKKGKLTLQRLLNGTWVTVQEGKGAPEMDHLVEVFRDGKLLVDRTFQKIRDRSNLAVHASP